MLLYSMLLFILSDADITIQPWTAVYIAYLPAPLLAPTVTVGEMEGAMDSASVFFFCL